MVYLDKLNGKRININKNRPEINPDEGGKNEKTAVDWPGDPYHDCRHVGRRLGLFHCP